MSRFIQRILTQKPLLTEEEHITIAKRLKRRYMIEKTLQTLCIRSKETSDILKQLRSMCNRSRLGRTVEYILRRWQNQEGKGIEPIQYPVITVEVSKEQNRHHLTSKARSLRLEFLHKQIQDKIDEDPSAYYRQSEMEAFIGLFDENVPNKLKRKATDVSEFEERAKKSKY